MITVQKRPGYHQRLVLFEYRAPKKARQVSLVGSFNGWNVNMHLMRPNWRGCWEAAVHLPPGRYEYKFVVDGHAWRPDSAAPGGKQARDAKRATSVLQVT